MPQIDLMLRFLLPDIFSARCARRYFPLALIGAKAAHAATVVPAPQS
jgi:hypothetical protein